MRKKKSTLSKILTGASAGAAIGFITYFLVKTEKSNLATEKHFTGNTQKEKLFI